MYYKQLGFNSYQDFLKSRHWVLKKAQVYGTRSKTNCWICKTSNNLNVHHQTYVRLGDEDLNDLVILCQSCHKAVHEFHNEHPGLTLSAATRLYQIKIKSPNQYASFMKKQERRRRYPSKKVKLNYKQIQAQENEFNRRKLERFEAYLSK